MKQLFYAYMLITNLVIYFDSDEYYDDLAIFYSRRLSDKKIKISRWEPGA